MHWFVRRGLRVLMYHKVSPVAEDEHTVSVARLERQLRWLLEEKYQFTTLANVLRDALPDRPVLVTFDDAYVDTFEFARPVLRALDVPAAVFVPTAFIGQTSSWDRDARPLMDAAQLHTLAADGFELGVHSHRHENYAELSAAQVTADVREGFATLRGLGLAVAPALAYPYGGRPRAAGARVAMQAALRESGVRLAFRVGNRVNRLPLANALEIQRLSVRGDESLGAFQRRVAWGKLL
jgi:peptidoglycan/xylan/chitin deacetylase (PgdA/CDA1 family)